MQVYLKTDVSEQVEVLSIEPEILQQLRVVWEVWIVSRHWKITVTHHLFGGVNHQGAIDAALL